ncbi:MAG TPA: hypothetical protein VFM73_01390 [Xanthomonadaceae bacterium]|nr:hypothetical protein [Xanthomonadaceae bacterium]
MPYPTNAPDDDAVTGHVVGQWSPRGHYGVAVRDIFSNADWTPAEPVRARDWHDIGTGVLVQSTETTFD